MAQSDHTHAPENCCDKLEKESLRMQEIPETDNKDHLHCHLANVHEQQPRGSLTIPAQAPALHSRVQLLCCASSASCRVTTQHLSLRRPSQQGLRKRPRRQQRLASRHETQQDPFLTMTCNHADTVRSLVCFTVLDCSQWEAGDWIT